jgi:hypothetical protein
MRFILAGALLAAFLLARPAFAQGYQVYVAPPPLGNDSNNGRSPTTPFATPARASAAIRTIAKGVCAKRNGNVTVSFMNGSGLNYGFYPLTGTWTLTSADSGCPASTVTYTNYQGSAPVISGGIRISLNRVGAGGNLYAATLPATLSGYSPEALFYNQGRRFRARLSASSGYGLQGLAGGYFRIAGNGTFGTASLKDCGSHGGDPCYDRFLYDPNDPNGDPFDGYAAWGNYSASNDSLGEMPCTGEQPTNGPAGDIEVLVFEYWTVSRMRIACVDKPSHTVYLTGNTATNSTHGFKIGHRYVIENVNTGIQSSPALLPGQFFIDRSATPYILYYEAQEGENPATATVVLPVLAPDNGSGAVLSATDIQYVTFSGLQFSHDNTVPGARGYASLQSDYLLTAMVSCVGCANTTWNGDTFTQTTGHGLWFHTDKSSTPTSNVVENSNFYDLGAGGLGYGDLPKMGDTENSTLSNGTISNNLVESYGRMYPGSSGIESALSHNTSIENNDVTDGYNTGIGICIPAGITSSYANCGGPKSGGTSAHDILGVQNHVWNIGKGVTDDMGAFYIATYSAEHNEIRNNKLHDVVDAQVFDSDGYGGNGIYIDNVTGRVTVDQNLVYRVSYSTARNTDGPDPTFCKSGQKPEPNIFYDNILSYARVTMFNEGGVPRQIQPESCLTEKFMSSIFYFDRDSSAGCGGGQNPEMCSFYMQSGFTVLNSAPLVAQEWGPNLYYNTAGSYDCPFYTNLRGNTTGGCRQTPYDKPYSLSGWQGLGQDTGSTANTNNPEFSDPTCQYPTAPQCAADPTQDDFSIPGYPEGSSYPISDGYNFPVFGLTFGRQCGTTCFTPPAYATQDTFPTNVYPTPWATAPIFSTESGDPNNNYAF